MAVIAEVIQNNDEISLVVSRGQRQVKKGVSALIDSRQPVNVQIVGHSDLEPVRPDIVIGGKVGDTGQVNDLSLEVGHTIQSQRLILKETPVVIYSGA